MYSNDDDRRRDEQRRWEEQRRDEQRRHDEQRRRDDAVAYQRRQQEQRDHEQAWARKDAQARELHAQEQERRADDERHDRDWDEWRKQQTARSGAYAAPASSPSSAPQATSSSRQSGDDGLGALVGLAILLLLLAMPPLLAFAVLEEFIQKFPRYAVDPSFGGQVAGFFVQTLGGEWAKTLHKWVDTSFRRKDYWQMFLYSAGVWVILACGLSLIRQMFRVHVMAGLVTMLALLGPMGLFMYVSWHFSR